MVVTMLPDGVNSVYQAWWDKYTINKYSILGSRTRQRSSDDNTILYFYEVEIIQHAEKCYYISIKMIIALD